MATWVMEFISAAGYWSIVLLMFLENVFPPIPSELIMPLAGFMISERKLSFFGAIVSGTIGSVFGALPLYYAGSKLGEERIKRFTDRYGCWLTVSRQDIDRASGWFKRHGRGAVFICRLIPGIRSLVSIPAGIARMNVLSFLAYTAIGTAAWTALLVWLGYVMGSSFEKISDYLDPVSWVVFGAIAVFYVVRVITIRRRALADPQHVPSCT